MKKFIIFFVLFIITQSCFAISQYRTTSDLNIRSKPTTQSTVLSVIKKNSIINVISIEGDWAKISFSNKNAYVSSKYLVFVSSSTNSKNVKQQEIKKTPWYSPMSWGVIGWLIRWVLLPFLVFTFGIIFPSLLIAEVREINNFFLGILLYILGYFLLKLFIFMFQIFDVYNGTGESIVLWVLGILMGVGGISSIIKSRCPRCHYNNSRIIESFVESRRYKKTTTYGDGSKDVSHYTENDTHNHHICPECGYDWWVQE